MIFFINFPSLNSRKIIFNENHLFLVPILQSNCKTKEYLDPKFKFFY